MHRIPYFIISLGLITVMTTGCATAKYPKTLTANTSAKLKYIGIVDEIRTPTTLSTRTTTGSGVLGTLVAAGVEASREQSFTSQVRASLDFQRFAEEALRESFAKAVKSRPNWCLVQSNVVNKADAAFLLEVTDMGVDYPHCGLFKTVYQPTITITATLIGNPPFEIVGTRDKDVQVVDSASHPILYRRAERISYQTGCTLKSKAANSVSSAEIMG